MFPLIWEAYQPIHSLLLCLQAAQLISFSKQRTNEGPGWLRIDKGTVQCMLVLFNSWSFRLHIIIIIITNLSTDKATARLCPPACLSFSLVFLDVPRRTVTVSTSVRPFRWSIIRLSCRLAHNKNQQKLGRQHWRSVVVTVAGAADAKEIIVVVVSQPTGNWPQEEKHPVSPTSVHLVVHPLKGRFPLVIPWFPANDDRRRNHVIDSQCFVRDH